MNAWLIRPDRRYFFLVGALVAGVAVGCGSSGGGVAADGGPAGSGGASGPDSSVDGNGTGGAGVDGSVGPDGGADGPAPGSNGKRLVAGRARLVGSPTTACSQPGAGGEHWCAFTLPGAALGSTALWVINIEKAQAGGVVCDGTSPSCLRLTTNLWTGQPDTGPSHPGTHHFYGQSLLFYAGDVSATQAFEGPVFAWRPGWTEARQLSAKALSCDGQVATDGALCIENLQGSGATTHFDLRAGRIGTTGSLPSAATIYTSTATNAQQWSIAFSPAGDYLLWSTGTATAGDPETLYAAKLDDVGTPAKTITVGAKISQWDVSPDGKHWYFLRDYNYPPRNSPTDPTGTLAIADFPGGGNERVLAMKVGLYVPLGDAQTDSGLTFLSDLAGGKGAYKRLRDTSKPTDVTTIASGVLNALGSDDDRFSFVQTDVDATTFYANALVAKNDGTGMCTLAAGKTADYYGAPFLPHAGLVLWADNINATTGQAQGWLAKPDCSGKQKFSDDVFPWYAAGDRGLIFSELPTAAGATLRFAKLGPAGEWPAAGPTTIRAGAGFVYGLVEPDRQYVVYEFADGKPEDDGLWIYGPIGFGQP